MKLAKFKVKLEGAGPRRSMYAIALPEAVRRKLGISVARMPIAGTADGKPFRTSAMNMGAGHMFVFTRELQAATGKGDGDTVAFEVWEDDEPRTVQPPRDLLRALAENAAALRNFQAMSFTHRKEYVRWIEGAKKPETRARRLEKAVQLCAAKKPAP